MSKDKHMLVSQSHIRNTSEHSLPVHHPHTILESWPDAPAAHTKQRDPMSTLFMFIASSSSSTLFGSDLALHWKTLGSVGFA